MTATPTLFPVDPTTRAQVRAHIDAACARIAPAWPLDRLIAVNPYWGWTDRPIADAAATIGATASAPMLMPRSWYRAQRAAGLIPDEAIETAIKRRGLALRKDDVLAALYADAPELPHHPLVSELRDAQRDPAREVLWRDYLLQQVGQTCEAYFDAAQAPWAAVAPDGLYAFWRELMLTDRTPQLLLGAPDIRDAAGELPDTAEALIAEALDTLALPRAARTTYLTAVLLSVIGWASAAAHRRFEARLRHADDETIVELLAVRLGWELLLYRTATASDLPSRWTQDRRRWQDLAEAVPRAQEPEWILQRAFEVRYQEKLANALAWHPTLRHADSGAAAPATVSAQAVFCIDVRSEVFRRHLEDCDGGIHTLGFAGFFGVPLEYQPLLGASRPQLPGLLAPGVVAEDRGEGVDTLRGAIVAQGSARAQWKGVAGGVPSTFAFVESTGLAAAFRMLRASFEPERAKGDARRYGLDAGEGHVVPTLTRRSDGSALDGAAKVDIAAGILRGMSLTQGFAPLVAFIGHGALVVNNPQAAGLACGACGGQSGEINARVAAGLLNEPAVRSGLRERGIEIPDRTRFVGGLHDTTTDDLLFFPDAETAASHAQVLAEFRAACARASRRTRAERAARLGIETSDPFALADALRHRAADWSEVRPEWALAGNAAFIAAPRRRTRALDLKGRAFLHEYDERRDADHGVLELILTAPVVVAHWINFQYWASTVDPSRFGSGDKTRHNVAGGSLGVYEGAGGDLRIGLAQQSVHDGTRFVHDPMRLGVYLEAGEAAIDAILAKHAHVRALVEHEWMFLYRIDPETSSVTLRTRSGWEPIASGNAARW
ncbi:DUF2309 domain-containing protein [Pseudogemmatithrix spongiicola]|uniref:Probable inorganic carbon transporter subunit DabA n=1 Tax=Pseudogemmatithrix spongiicola TaxID=3062599 RepID=A0AA49JVY6_9BACT|nr:DUF2309 domain-containing protein [Gemmatimonadaceae bacterium 'strain 138']WKW15525.1 DUF2309 domain-containing protein [Gemmatimonadaceae bacterium 'strain 318']